MDNIGKITDHSSLERALKHMKERGFDGSTKIKIKDDGTLDTIHFRRGFSGFGYNHNKLETTHGRMMALSETLFPSDTRDPKTNRENVVKQEKLKDWLQNEVDLIRNRSFDLKRNRDFFNVGFFQKFAREVEQLKDPEDEPDLNNPIFGKLSSKSEEALAFLVRENTTGIRFDHFGVQMKCKITPFYEHLDENFSLVEIFDPQRKEGPRYEFHVSEKGNILSTRCVGANPDKDEPDLHKEIGTLLTALHGECFRPTLKVSVEEYLNVPETLEVRTNEKLLLYRTDLLMEQIVSELSENAGDEISRLNVRFVEDDGSDNSGQDVGGISRDFMTRLINSFTNPENPSSPLREFREGVGPLLSPPNDLAPKGEEPKQPEIVERAQDFEKTYSLKLHGVRESNLENEKLRGDVKELFLKSGRLVRPKLPHILENLERYRKSALKDIEWEEKSKNNNSPLPKRDEVGQGMRNELEKLCGWTSTTRKDFQSLRTLETTILRKNILRLNSVVTTQRRDFETALKRYENYSEVWRNHQQGLENFTRQQVGFRKLGSLMMFALNNRSKCEFTGDFERNFNTGIIFSDQMMGLISGFMTNDKFIDRFGTAEGSERPKYLSELLHRSRDYLDDPSHVSYVEQALQATGKKKRNDDPENIRLLVSQCSPEGPIEQFLDRMIEKELLSLTKDEYLNPTNESLRELSELCSNENIRKEWHKALDSESISFLEKTYGVRADTAFEVATGMRNKNPNEWEKLSREVGPLSGFDYFTKVAPSSEWNSAGERIQSELERLLGEQCIGIKELCEDINPESWSKSSLLYKRLEESARTGSLSVKPDELHDYFEELATNMVVSNLLELVKTDSFQRLENDRTFSMWEEDREAFHLVFQLLNTPLIASSIADSQKLSKELRKAKKVLELTKQNQTQRQGMISDYSRGKEFLEGGDDPILLTTLVQSYCKKEGIELGRDNPLNSLNLMRITEFLERVEQFLPSLIEVCPVKNPLGPPTRTLEDVNFGIQGEPFNKEETARRVKFDTSKTTNKKELTVMLWKEKMLKEFFATDHNGLGEELIYAITGSKGTPREIKVLTYDQDTYLPRMHTCFSQIDLAPYFYTGNSDEPHGNPEKFKTLETAINETLASNRELSLEEALSDKKLGPLFDGAPGLKRTLLELVKKDNTTLLSIVVTKSDGEETNSLLDEAEIAYWARLKSVFFESLETFIEQTSLGPSFDSA